MQNKSAKCPVKNTHFKAVKIYILLNLQLSILEVADDFKFTILSKVEWHSGLCFPYCFPFVFFSRYDSISVFCNSIFISISHTKE